MDKIDNNEITIICLTLNPNCLVKSVLLNDLKFLIFFFIFNFFFVKKKLSKKIRPIKFLKI